MKKIFYFLFSLASAAVFAQAPQGIPYQAIARNASGQAIASTAVKVRFSIRDSIATGAIKYQETHNPTTSALGLFSVNVGMGTVVSGSFSGINWGKNAKFLQVEMDPAGGTTYTNLGTTQMMSVPYAMNAANGLPLTGITKDDVLKFDGISWKPGKSIPALTTRQRDALPVASKYAGFTFFNSSTKCLEYYDGSCWLSLCGSTAMVGDTSLPSDLTEIGQTVSRLSWPVNLCPGDWIGSNSRCALFYAQSWGPNCQVSYSNYSIYKFNPFSNTVVQVPVPDGFFQVDNNYLQSTQVNGLTYKDKIAVVSRYYNSSTSSSIYRLYVFDDNSNSWTIKNLWSTSGFNFGVGTINEKGFVIDSLFYFRTNQSTSSINLNSGEVKYNETIYNPATSNLSYYKYYDITNDEKLLIEQYGIIRKFKPKQYGVQQVKNTSNSSGWEMDLLKIEGDQFYFSVRDNNSSGRIFTYDFSKGTSRFLDNHFYPYNDEFVHIIRIGKRFFRLNRTQGSAPNCYTYDFVEVKF
jgi:hypothetical protein